jgi:hypothetical protein
LAPLMATFSVARNLLAIRAKMTAAACHDDATNGSFAAQARPSFAIVDTVMLLVISREAVRTEKIGNGRTTEGDSFAKNFLQLGVEKLDLGGPQAGSDLGRMNLGAPQTFVGINVSDAADDGLVEKKGLDARVAAADQFDEGFASGFERVDAEAQEFLLKARAHQEGHATETPWIDIAKFATVVEKEDHVGVFRMRLGHEPRHERAGHAEMHEESGRFLRGGVSEPQKHEFAVAFDTLDGTRREMQFDFSGIIDEVGFTQCNRENATAGNFALQAAGYGFDFGKFRHGRFAFDEFYWK